MQVFGQDRELGLCPEVNKLVTDPLLLQMEILMTLLGMSFSNSAIIHIPKITKHWQKCLYFCIGWNKLIF